MLAVGEGCQRLLTSKQVKTPKHAAATIDKPMSEWTLRRALLRIDLTSAIKQKKNQRCQKKCRGSFLNFARNTKIAVSMNGKGLYCLMK